MRIDGKRIAELLLTHLASDVETLKQQGRVPTIAVILVGDDPASVSYINQKKKAAEKIGARAIIDHQAKTITKEALHTLIQTYNNDPSVHGLIIQRPIPKEVGDVTAILFAVDVAKDVDGLVPGSPYMPPISGAVLTILGEIHTNLTQVQLTDEQFLGWLRSQSIAIVGRGETGGKPIAATLAGLQCATSIIHSQTSNTQEILQNATVIISCVGKEKIITQKNIKPGAILISVGIWQDADGKLHGDYEEEDIASTAAFYTPTPRGVGPVNVACLMQNLVQACTMKKGGHL